MIAQVRLEESEKLLDQQTFYWAGTTPCHSSSTLLCVFLSRLGSSSGICGCLLICYFIRSDLVAALHSNFTARLVLRGLSCPSRHQSLIARPGESGLSHCLGLSAFEGTHNPWRAP
ncbi:hypothetical protein CBOM_07738 [Ceraceosorus bombacis]|uniref:Uncharacterized protein n=1 Tax=Ceraceosorus bombacis TaxID=401625 RepID=A0A0P1BHK4_9BASI|nr:hypothetical protein CBOM_07738 [Ceraceosorus bombacis]